MTFNERLSYTTSNIDPYLQETFVRLTDSDVDVYKKMHYFQGLKNYIEKDGNLNDLLSSINLSNEASVHDMSIMLNVLQFLMRANMELKYLIKDQLAGVIEKCDLLDTNYFLWIMANQAVNWELTIDYNVNYMNAPIDIGDERYVISDSWGLLLISDKENYSLLRKIAPYAKSRQKNFDYRHRLLEKDFTDKLDADEDVDLDNHFRFMWRRGEDFKKEAQFNYGFHKLSLEDIDTTQLGTETSLEEFEIFFISKFHCYNKK